MESCTSGQIASLITDSEGSSAIFKGALITYSNEFKEKVLKISELFANQKIVCLNLKMQHVMYK